jgi:hypothetical protein
MLQDCIDSSYKQFRSSYQQYKSDSDTVATWLANTAKQNGYPKDLLDSHKPQPAAPPKPGRLKGRARKLAHAASEARQAREQNSEPASTQEISQPPRYLIAVKDFINLSEWIAGSTKPRIKVPATFIAVLDRAIVTRKEHHRLWQSKDDSSESDSRFQNSAEDTHLYFIGVLEKVREILTPLKCPQDPEKINTAPSQEVSDASNHLSHFTNQFDALEVEEPSEGFASAESASGEQKTAETPKLQYGVDTFSIKGESHYAFTLILGDLDDMRQYLQFVWTGYRTGSYSLTAAALTTDTAIELARELHDDYVGTFPENADLETNMRVIYGTACFLADIDPREAARSEDPMDFALWDRVERFFYPAWLHVAVTLENATPGRIMTVGRSRISTYDASSDRTSKSPREKLLKDCWILGHMLPDFCVFANLDEDEAMPAEDQMMIGLRELFLEKKVSIWLVFAVQVFLDIHHVCRTEVSKGFKDLTKEADRVAKNIKEILDFHKNLESRVWPKIKQRDSPYSPGRHFPMGQ